MLAALLKIAQQSLPRALGRRAAAPSASGRERQGRLVVVERREEPLLKTRWTRRKWMPVVALMAWEQRRQKRQIAQKTMGDSHDSD